MNRPAPTPEQIATNAARLATLTDKTQALITEDLLLIGEKIDTNTKPATRETAPAKNQNEFSF